MAKKSKIESNIEVKVFPIASAKAKKAGLLANVSVTINDKFVIRNILIRDGKKGAFVSMPSEKGKDGEYYDIAFPCTKEAREALNEAIMDAYDKL